MTTDPRRLINPEARAELEAAIDAHINTGVRAARYDGDNGTTGGGDGSSVVEQEIVGTHRPETPSRAACPALADPDFLNPDTECDCVQRPDSISEKAINDGARLRGAIAILLSLEAEYQPQHRGKTPGYGPCPTGKCRDCWRAGVERAATKARYTGLCRRCGDYRKRNGHPIPPLVIRALSVCGGDWNHWSVKRAQRAS